MDREFKDSGIEWIGKIPRDWKVTVLKRLCRNITDGSHFSPPTQNIGKKYITVSNVYNDKVHIEEAANISYEDFCLLVANGCQPPIGSILLAKDGTVGRTAIVENNDYVVLSSLGILSPSTHTLSNYIKYLLDSDSLQAQMQLAMAGSALRRITITKINSLIGLLPPIDEQQRIADYLDKKCSEIDELIALQEQMIAQLTDYKQSVITEAVTKGINPDVQLVPSGIDWIGDIPKGWKECRIKDLVYLQSGTNLTSMEISDNGTYPVYGGNGLRGYFSEYSNDGEFILIGRQGALCGNINYANGKFWATEHAVVCYPKRLFPIKWLGELLRAMNLGQYSLSAAQPGLAVERIKNLKIPLPPFDEQQSIAIYLDTKCSEIDSLISLKQQKIETLKVYKKSVIYEAVTGKTIICETP